MSVKIRLARRGRRKRPYYHIIVADSRAPRDGRFIEMIGSYNPMTNPATIELDVDKAYDWLTSGAQPTYTAKAILRFKGVLYKKHLQRGVEKGAMTQEEADQKLKTWIADKDAQLAVRIEKSKLEKEEYLKMISGEIKVAKKTTADDEAKEVFREGQPEATPVVEVAEVEKVVEAEPKVEAAEVEKVAEVVTEKVAETPVEEAVEATTEEVVESTPEPEEPATEVKQEITEEASAEDKTPTEEE